MRGWRRIAVGLVLSLGAMGVGEVARAEILNADLQVHGMACPFCAFGIEKKLLDVEGVTKVEVLLDEGRLQLQLAPGNAATPAAFEAAVEKAGFELADLAVEVRGTLDVGSTQTWLEAHRGLRLLLLERDGAGEQPLSPATRERLRVDEEGHVVVSGRVLGTGEARRLLVELPQAGPIGGP